MALGESYVVRAKDNSGDSIAAFTDATGRFIQAMALVNEAGDQIAVSGNPLYISFSGDGTMVLSSDTIDALTSATSVTESILVDNNGARTGLSTNPFFVASTSGTDPTLFAVLYDSNGKPARVDTSTHTLQVISYPHHEIHGGSNYEIKDVVDLANGAVRDMQFTTPNTEKWSHLFLEFNVEAETEWYLYEGVTINLAGAEVIPVNSNRNSLNTSGMSVSAIDNSNVANANADTTTGSLAVYHGIAGSGRNEGTHDHDHEIILAQNTIYSIRFIANAAGYVDYHFSWYEHTDKT